MNVPKIAAAITISMLKIPEPNRMYIGPGHAPISAQPKPKMMPPIIYLIVPFSFKGINISAPFIDFILPFLLIEQKANHKQ